MAITLTWRVLVLGSLMCGCQGNGTSNVGDLSSTISLAAASDSMLRGDTILIHPRLGDAAWITVVGGTLLAVAAHGVFVDVYRLSDGQLVGTLGRGLLTTGEAPS